MTEICLDGMVTFQTDLQTETFSISSKKQKSCHFESTW